MAVPIAHTTPARRTRRKSWSTVRQVSTVNIQRSPFFNSKALKPFKKWKEAAAGREHPARMVHKHLPSSRRARDAARSKKPRPSGDDQGYEMVGATGIETV